MATKSVRRELQQHVVPERLDALRPLAPVHTMHQRFKAVLVDLSGTLHVGSQALPGAVQALQKLRAHGGLQVLIGTLYIHCCISWSCRITGACCKGQMKLLHLLNIVAQLSMLNPD